MNYRIWLMEIVLLLLKTGAWKSSSRKQSSVLLMTVTPLPPPRIGSSRQQLSVNTCNFHLTGYAGLKMLPSRAMGDLCKLVDETTI